MISELDLENQLLEQNMECSNDRECKCNYKCSFFDFICENIIKCSIIIFFFIIFLVFIFYIAELTNAMFHVY